MSITLGNSQPIKHGWKVDVDGEKWEYGEECGLPKYIIDQSTGEKYLNESEEVVRIKCGLLFFGTFIVHPLASVIKIYNLLTSSHFCDDKGKGTDSIDSVVCSHFGINKNGKKSNYNFTARLADAGIDFLRIIATPFSILALLFATLYGLYSPYDGRKLYATIERVAYGKAVLAPCFQPYPKSHALGGDINRRNAF